MKGKRDKAGPGPEYFRLVLVNLGRGILLSVVEGGGLPR